MTRRGFVEILVLVVLVLLATGTVVLTKQSLLKDVFKNISSPKADSERRFDLTLPVGTPSPTPSSVSSPLPAISPSPTPRSVSKVTPTPSPSPKPASTPIVVKKVSTCSVNAPGVSEDDPMKLNLSAAVLTSGGRYITGTQWDFEGDGSWDTDFSQGTSFISHKYSQNGSFNTRVQVKMSDGETTDVCSRTVTVPQGVKVSFTGQVYRDVNCNGIHEPNEGGISGVEVNFFTPEYYLYKTIATDGNGYYNLSVYINQGDALELKSSSVAAPGYKLYQSSYPPTALNAAFPTINKDLPQVPNENIGSCGG